MKVENVYKIGVSEYNVQNGSIFERVLAGGAPALDLTEIHVLRDDVTNYFELPARKEELSETTNTEIQALIDHVITKYLDELKMRTQIMQSLTEETFVAKRITLPNMTKPYAAVMLYVKHYDRIEDDCQITYVPHTLLIWHIVETFMLQDALINHLEKDYKYEEDDHHG